MLVKDRLRPTKKIYFKSEIKHCPHCESKLRRSHTAWHKKIATLHEVIEACSMAYKCVNPNCSNLDAQFISAEAESLSPKHSAYGFDVLCLVGELRFKRHMTRKEIADELNERGVLTPNDRHKIFTKGTKLFLQQDWMIT